MSQRYLFTVVVFVLWILGFSIASSMGGTDLLSMFMRASPVSILLGFVLYFVCIGTGILILYRSLRYTGLKPPVKGVAKAWLFGAFIDNIGPTVAPFGQAGIAYFLEKFYNIAYSKSLAAIGMYVSSWGISASIFSSVALLLSQIFVGILQEYVLFAILALVFYCGATTVWLLLLTKKELMRKIVHKFIMPYNKIYDLVTHKKVTFDPHVYDLVFDRSYASVDTVMKGKRHIMVSVALFWIPQAGQVTCLYFMILGFGIQISFFQVVMVHVVSSMIGMLSIIPSGLFVYEAAVVKLTDSVSPGTGEFVLAAVMLYRLIFVWMTNFMGGLIGVLQGIGKIERRPNPYV